MLDFQRFERFLKEQSQVLVLQRFKRFQVARCSYATSMRHNLLHTSKRLSLNGLSHFYVAK